MEEQARPRELRPHLGARWLLESARMRERQLCAIIFDCVRCRYNSFLQSLSTRELSALQLYRLLEALQASFDV
jgi:hypothetical protein